MGGLWSKEEQNNIVEQDNGFHMVEVHAPTMGLSVIAILIILAILGLGHRCATTMRKRYLRRPRYYQGPPGMLQQVQPRRTYPTFGHEQYRFFDIEMLRRQTPPGSIHEIPMEHMAAPGRQRQYREPAENGNHERNTQRETRSTAVATNIR